MTICILKLLLLCGSRPISARASSTFGSHCSKFHPNQFTFGGVIAEHVKTVIAPCSILQYRLFEPIIIVDLDSMSK